MIIIIIIIKSQTVFHSFDEHALIDVPTMVDYILNVTSQKQLYYVGHSQGTTLGFVGFTSDQELAAKIRRFYALAPLTNLHHLRGGIWLMSIVPETLRVSKLKSDTLCA